MNVLDIMKAFDQLPLNEQFEVLYQVEDRLEGKGDFTQEDFDEWERRYQDHLAHPETSMTLEQLNAYVKRPR